MAKTKNSKSLSAGDRITFRVEKEDRAWLDSWAREQARAAGLQPEQVGLSAGIRAAIKAFRHGTSRDAATDEGYAQGVRLGYAETRQQLQGSLGGALAGLTRGANKKR